MMMPYRKLYRLIEGRSGRQEYWMFFLFNALFFAGLVLLTNLLVGGTSELDLESVREVVEAGTGLVLAVLLMILACVWWYLVIPAWVSVTIRRLHDLNVTGWLCLVYLVLVWIPVLNFFVFIGFNIFMALPGTKGPNKYGEDPLNPVDIGTFE